MLDLFAGSGALGLEALSRGARFCLFIEDSAEARAAIRRNVEALDLTGATKIWRRDATKLGEAGTLQPFDLVFLDPPYGKGLGEGRFNPRLRAAGSGRARSRLWRNAQTRRSRCRRLSRRSTGASMATQNLL